MTLRGTPVDIVNRGEASRGGGAAVPSSPARGLFPEIERSAQAPAVAQSVVLRPPEEVQYPDARDLWLGGSVPALAGSAIAATYVIPPNNVAVIRSVVMSAVNVTTTMILFYGITINGAAVEGWSGRQIPPQNSSIAIITYGPGETLIRCPEAATIQLRVFVAGGPASVHMEAAGWYYPTTLSERFARLWTG